MGMNLDAKFQETNTQFEADFGEVLTLKGDKGDKGEKGEPGKDGYTPVRGTDYWTDADKEEIKSYVDKDLAKAVKSVNGVCPDSTGSVDIPQLGGSDSALYVGPESGEARVEICAGLPNKSEDGYVQSGTLCFLCTDDDQRVQLCHIASGIYDDSAATVGQLNAAVGDISTALDSIIAMQEELIGGDS